MPTHDLRPASVLTAILGQMALLLPWIYIPAAAAMWPKSDQDWNDQRRLFCLALSVPGIVLLKVDAFPAADQVRVTNALGNKKPGEPAGALVDDKPLT